MAEKRRKSVVERQLIIFIKNPELGTAKTRLAKTIGDEKALEVYQMLLAHTRQVTSATATNRKVYYSKFADETDAWVRPTFDKGVQITGSLGEKMEHAFAENFKAGKEAIVIIGSDCIALRPHHLEAAFTALETKDFVIGPAEDGGYYLLGMRTLLPSLFHNMEWSTDQVLPETIRRIEDTNGSYQLLETLSDIDHEEDLVDELRQVLN